MLSRLAGLAALATVAPGLYLYAPDKPRAELEAAYPGEYRIVDGVRLRLRDTGPRGAPAVILLHGFCASLDTWEPWARALSERYRVVRFDLPGFGLTGPDPTGDYSDARQMKVLADLIDQLGVARAILVGNSMGGRIAWNFAAAHPDRVSRLVLVSPDGFASPGFAYDRAGETPLIMQALPYVAPPRSLLKVALSAAYARLDELSETTLDRYRDLLLAPGVRRALVARMSSGDPARPRPDAGPNQGPDAPDVGREGWRDPHRPRRRLPARSAAGDSRSPAESRPCAFRGEPRRIIRPAAAFSFRRRPHR